MGINLESLDPELRKKILNLNNLQQSLEFLTSQKMHLESSFRECELAISELEKISDDTTVYKSIGGIMVKSEKRKLLDEKKSLKVTLEMRLKTIKSKESIVTTQIDTMRKSVQADLQSNQS